MPEKPPAAPELSGCAPAAESTSISVAAGTVVIGVQSASFDSVARQLPADGTYVVHCHSGSRAAAAISRLTTLGFTHLTNGGGLDAASSATGMGIVQ